MAAGYCLATAACGRSGKAIVVGSENTTEQIVVGEIVAQHLEHRLHRKIGRRLGLGDEPILYQALLSGDATLYPDYPEAIATSILKVQPDTDAAVVLERAKNELRRTAQLELLDPLGYESSPVVVVKTANANSAKVRSLSDAEAGTLQWKLGVSYQFQQRPDGLPALNIYRIPMSQSIRGMEMASLFPALESDQVTMIVASAADGHLHSGDFTVLADDRHALPKYQASLVVRADALAAEPRLRLVLAELAGRLSTETVRSLNAAVEVDHRKPADVASEFLRQSGLN